MTDLANPDDSKEDLETLWQKAVAGDLGAQRPFEIPKRFENPDAALCRRTEAFLMGKVVELGHSAQPPEISKSHRALLLRAIRQRFIMLAYARGLEADTLRAFVKAVAMLEDGLSLGSTTELENLMPMVDDPDRALLDWILRNTTSYSYYARGARSIKEYDAIRKARADSAAAGIKRDLERQERDRKRIAAESTAKLFNAVRRGDIKAVRALIKKGADVTFASSNGVSLHALARAKGHDEIANELQAAMSPIVTARP